MHVYVHLLLYALWEALSGVRVHNRNADRLAVPVIRYLSAVFLSFRAALPPQLSLALSLRRVAAFKRQRV